MLAGMLLPVAALGANNFKDLYAGYLLPLNDLLDQYGPTIKERTTDFGFQCCTVDGKI